MPRLVRPLLLVCLVLLVPVVPFLVWGEPLEAWISAQFDPPPPPWTLALATTAVLATDIFLPVPSSVVGTLAGAQLGVATATAAAWLGLTLGGIAGFGLARVCGRPWVQRFCSTTDLEALDRGGMRAGPWLVALSRPLPVLAEATVLLLGATELPWRRFLPALMLSNLGVSLVYAALGRVAYEHSELPLAIAASIALPLIASGLVRRQWLPRATAAAELAGPLDS